MDAAIVNNGTTNVFNTEMSSPVTKDAGDARFSGRNTSEVEGERYSQSRDNSESKSSILDRIAYPFRAIKNRLINSAALGGVVGFSIPVILSAFVGAITGGIAKGIVKLAGMIRAHNYSASEIGQVVGLITIALVSLPASVALGAAGAVAGLVVGMAGSAVLLPMDIYRAATLPESGLNPWALQDEEMVDEV